MLLPFEIVYAMAGGALLGIVMTLLLRRIRIARWIGPTLTAISAAMLGVMFLFATRVVEIANDPAGATTRKLVLVGSATVTLDGKPVELSQQDRSKTIVLNESDKPLRLSMHLYASAPPESPDDNVPERIAPRSVHILAHDIDFVGPENRPPDHVDSRSSTETKYWLTW